MSTTSEPTVERTLATAASDLCSHEISREKRRSVSIFAVFGTAVFATAGLALTLRLSPALAVSIWVWAAVMTAVFWSGRIPALFGFGAVTGAFESSHHQYFEGAFTKMVKTLRFRPRY
jgi:hypothetical protein